MSKDGVDTKQRIFDAAVKLFSERGFQVTSMKKLAAEANITPGSIYNHFHSKQEIVDEIYAFYHENWQKVLPHLDDLLAAAETEEPISVLRRLTVYYDPEIQKVMDRILIIAVGMSRFDARSEAFVLEHIFQAHVKILLPVLNRMVELKRIEPVDTRVYCNLIAYMSFGTATLNSTSSMKIAKADWEACLAFVSSQIRPINTPEH
ncbi:MAG: TetR/AcrR family transcriptional regulator [Oscillospiraceae bacterium]|nr:TetR/AcrR family transcriptional regulator [Oscillospiraceae bacterium]